MFLVIPEIRLADGECPDFIETEGRSDSYYEMLSSNPERLAQLFRRENAKSIMLSCINGFDERAMKALSYISEAVSIPIQLRLVGSKQDFDIEGLFEQGLQRLIVDFDLYKNLSDALPDHYGMRVFPIFNLDDTHNIAHLEPSKRVFVASSESKQWSFVDLEGISSELKGRRCTVIGGIKDYQALKLVSSFIDAGIDSAVIGRPLYDNSFPCQALWREVEAELDSLDYETPISSVDAD